MTTRSRAAGRVALLGGVAIAAAGAAGQEAQQEDVVTRASAVVVMPGPTREAVLYANGARISTEWETVWRPMCGSDRGEAAMEEIRGIAQERRVLREVAKAGGEQLPELDPLEPDGEPDGGIMGSNFDIVFVVDGSVPAEAEQAIADAEAYVEARFDDPIVIEIEVSFEEMAGGILGGTSTDHTFVSWTATRTALQAGMDSNDSIQDHLPPGVKIPVRYNGNTGTITQEGRVFWTLANFRAAVGTVAGQAGQLVFNDQVQWDYDPADGVSGFSFEDILIHEVGHVLGFSSGADYRYKDMDALDIFRFQHSDGGNDYNPDNAEEFAIRARLVSFDAPSPPNNNCITDLIGKEYRMSDGDPYQCSHFREQAESIGLMDPAAAPGQTRWPQFFSSADLKCFDAIGYDR